MGQGCKSVINRASPMHCVTGHQPAAAAAAAAAVDADAGDASPSLRHHLVMTP